MNILCKIVQLYIFVLLARVVLSWIPLAPGGAMARVNSMVFTVTEPLLAPVRRVIPPIRLGGASLDISTMLVIFLLPLLARLLFRC